MRKLILFALICLTSLAGCATANVKTVDPKGKTCEATYSSLFKGVDAATLEACGARGEVVKSQNDPVAEALREVLFPGLAK
ncbi:hypothetical protein [Desulfuromonas sp. TF]|uniref:hypothetical protein n=1 Tax=Desulfuromonas sp. TF TaxID=1232410 RepID=UPI00041F3055|nr:hypothetical protein [Desulfuromonas sp. TF]